MKSWIFLVSFFCCSLLLVSCDEKFVHVEGFDVKIQGKWQLTPADTVFYNFQNNLFQYQIYLNKDSILSMNGYYTLYGDTAILLELMSGYTYINMMYYTGPLLHPIGWDSISPSVLARYYRLEVPEKSKLDLTHPQEKLLFHKF